ncbi:hypothetical protein BJF79_26780 [Actinomadura sp. CNU-125]|uniref:hypothetical protein n=1 Tax=Actinomadura sp. CNU-125 TaxID=1904961 RepID=UPI00095928CC|nr:hypothetical protein [Actinomadura sp. CNU-125]OLT38447.1 hypothetical protein BJF79_26780 [Actinomadura sp. CNU-125]
MNDQELAELRTRYPAWNIRKPPNAECLVATRMGHTLSDREIYHGLSTTLIENTYVAPVEALANQNEIEDRL